MAMGATAGRAYQDGQLRSVTGTAVHGERFEYGVDADQVVTITTPIPAQGQSAQTTTYRYDALGRRSETLLPDGGSVSNAYYATGELRLTVDTRTYPVEYT